MDQIATGSPRQPHSGPQGCWPLLALGIVGAFVAWPTLRWLAHEWWTNDYYSHGPLVPLVSAFLAWRLWPTIRPRPANAGISVLIVGLAVYLAALASRAFFVASLALIVILAGLVWFLWGTQALRRMAFPLAFLLFMTPLPFIEASTVPLARFTGVCASGLMRLFGVEAVIGGSQIALPNGALAIGAPCSGVRSLISLLTLVAVALYLLQAPLWRKALLALATIPLALLGNIVRVASLLGVAAAWGVEAGFAYYHELSGIAFFLVALLGLLLLSRMLRCHTLRADLW